MSGPVPFTVEVVQDGCQIATGGPVVSPDVSSGATVSLAINLTANTGPCVPVDGGAGSNGTGGGNGSGGSGTGGATTGTGGVSQRRRGRQRRPRRLRDGRGDSTGGIIGTGGVVGSGGHGGSATGGVIGTGGGDRHRRGDQHRRGDRYRRGDPAPAVRSAPVASSGPAAWWAAVARAAVAAAEPSALAGWSAAAAPPAVSAPTINILPARDHHLRLLAERQRRLFRHRMRLRHEHLPADGGLPQRLSDWLLLRHQHLLQTGGDWLRWFGVHRNGPHRRDRGGPDLPGELAIAWAEGDPDRAPGRCRDRVRAGSDREGARRDRASPANHPPAGDRDRHRLLRHAGDRPFRADHVALPAACGSCASTSPARCRSATWCRPCAEALMSIPVIAVDVEPKRWCC